MMVIVGGSLRKRRQKLVIVVTFLCVLYMYMFSEPKVYLCEDFSDDSNKQTNQTTYSRMVKTDTKSCREQINVVFIKCMKCATETIGTIIRRFGYIRDLNFVVPVRHNIYLGWPFPIEKSDFRPSKRPYNILMEHSIYNHSVMSEFMPKNTTFITIIREPWKHFQSSFSYFGLQFIVAQPEINITQYLENIEKYESIFKSSANKHFRECLPNGFSIIKNLMSHCLGMPLGFPSYRPDITYNESAIVGYINFLENQFSLVMIADYFFESLILLKRKLCWSFKDIIFHRINVNKDKYQALPPKGKYYETFRKFSHVDFMLFDHFNKTLWRNIYNEGPSFFAEVEQFKVVQLLVELFCYVEGNNFTKGRNITVPSSQFNAEFTVTGKDCHLMSQYLLVPIRHRYNEVELQGKISDYWFANELPSKKKPPKGCSYPRTT